MLVYNYPIIDLFFYQQPKFSPFNELLIQLEIEKATWIIFQMECEDIFMDWCWKNPKCLNICLQKRCLSSENTEQGLEKKGKLCPDGNTRVFFKIALFFLARQFKAVYYWTKTNAFTPASESYHKAEDVQLVSAVA